MALPLPDFLTGFQVELSHQTTPVERMELEEAPMATHVLLLYLAARLMASVVLPMIFA
jgi:hypothetical protein